MENQIFSIKQALSIGWQKSWNNGRFLLGLCGIWIASMVVMYILGTIHPLFKLFNTIASPLITCGFSKIYYDIYTKGYSDYKELYESRKYYIATVLSTLYIGACVGFVVLITGGAIFGMLYLLRETGNSLALNGTIILLAILGAIAFCNILSRYLFVLPAIVSEDASSATQALNLSKAITKGHRLKIFGTMILLTLLVALSLGFLTAVVGIAWMHIYEKLKDADSSANDDLAIMHPPLI